MAKKKEIYFGKGFKRIYFVLAFVITFLLAALIVSEMEDPDWYKGGSYSSFSAAAFSKDTSSFNTSMSLGVTAASGGSGSGGGGFSGGGGGGGGGGSW